MIFLDIETLDIFQDEHIKGLPRPVQLLAMRFGLATTYNDRLPSQDAWRTWYVGYEPYLWQELINQTVVGWNILDFDISLLMLHLKAHYTYDGDPWLDPMQIVDLMDALKRASKPFGRERRYKLQDISMSNLGRGKNGDGQQAAQWLRSGDPDLMQQAAAYCREDVQLVIDLFQVAQTTGLLCPARAARGETGDLRVWLDADGQIVDCRRESV